jgi:hypothetical protein
LPRGLGTSCVAQRAHGGGTGDEEHLARRQGQSVAWVFSAKLLSACSSKGKKVCGRKREEGKKEEKDRKIGEKVNLKTVR